jgi:hypothetical protein
METAGGTHLLLGRRTDVGFRSFWPSVVDSPDATDENREISLVLGGAVVGDGRPMFGPEPVALTRLDVGVPGNTDNTILRYGVRR